MNTSAGAGLGGMHPSLSTDDLDEINLVCQATRSGRASG